MDQDDKTPPVSKRGRISVLKDKLFRRQGHVLELEPCSTSKQPESTNPESAKPAPTDRDITLGPISDLWDEAYRLLPTDVVDDYEQEIKNALGGATLMTGKTERCQQMKTLAEARTKKIEARQWKATLIPGQEIAVKDIVQPVVGVVTWAQKFVGDAVEASPPASIAWAGVCLLLPLLLNHSKQEASRIKGLEAIASIVGECSLREDRYHRRYETSIEGRRKQAEAHSNHQIYRDDIKALYLQILVFQATHVCFLSRNTAQRWLQDTATWEDWDTMVENIRNENSKLRNTDRAWNLSVEQENWEMQQQLQEKTVAVLERIVLQMTRNSQADDDAVVRQRRSELVKWLQEGREQDFARLKSTASNARGNLDTGRWLIQGGTFESWQSKPNSFVWLRGKAPTTHSPANLLRSLLAQLLSQKSSMPPVMDDLYSYYEAKKIPEDRILESALRSMTESFKDTYPAIDGLDECPNPEDNGTQRTKLTTRYRDQLLALVQNIGSWGHDGIHVFVASRPNRDIELDFGRSTHPKSRLDIDLDGHVLSREDMELFISQELQTKFFSGLDDDFKSEIKNTLIAKSGNMFQYVKLQLDTFHATSPFTKREARVILRDLPLDLYDTYDVAFRRVPLNRRQMAIRALTWVAVSPTPLTVADLAEAVLIPLASEITRADEGAAETDYSRPLFEHDDRFFSPNDVLDFLRGLLIVEPSGLDYIIYEGRTVRVPQYFPGDDEESMDRRQVSLTHFSLLEYLTSTKLQDKGFALGRAEAEWQVADACLRYYIHGAEVSPSLEETQNCYPLHIAHVADISFKIAERVVHQDWPQSIRRLIRRIMSPGGKSWAWIASDLCFDEDYSPTAFAALYQLTNILAFLVESGVPDEDDLAKTLVVARVRDHAAGVELLLDAGADLFRKVDHHGCAANALLAYYRREDDLRYIQWAYSSDFLAKARKAGYFIMPSIVCEKDITRYDNLITRLLINGLDLDEHRPGGIPPIHVAVAVGDPAGLEWLLSHGANIHVRDSCFGNALQLAVAIGKVKEVEILLRYGAAMDPDGNERADDAGPPPEGSQDSQTSWDNLLQNVCLGTLLKPKLEWVDSSPGDTAAQNLRIAQTVFGVPSRDGSARADEAAREYAIAFSEAIEANPWWLQIRWEVIRGNDGKYEP